MPKAIDKASLKAAFTKAIDARIGGDKNHGWGADDSLEVVEVVVNECLPKGEVLPEEALTFIRAVINPSAFRQVLESKEVKKLNPQPKGSGRSNSAKTLLV